MNSKCKSRFLKGLETGIELWKGDVNLSLAFGVVFGPDVGSGLGPRLLVYVAVGRLLIEFVSSIVLNLAMTITFAPTYPFGNHAKVPIFRRQQEFRN